MKQRRDSTSVYIAAAVWILGGIGMFIVGQIWFNQEGQLTQSSTGVARQCFYLPGPKEECKIVFKVDGKPYTAATGTKGNRVLAEPGEKRDVVYDPDNPANATIKEGNITAKSGWAFTIGGLVCISIGGFELYRGPQPKRSRRP